MNIINQATSLTAIQPFMKTDTTTLQDFELFKSKLESLLHLNHININGNNANQLNAINTVIIVGGDWIAREIKNMDYMEMTYKLVVDELALHFKDTNIQFHQLEFLETSLKPNEKIMDFFSRLRPIARAAKMETDDNIKLRFITITLHNKIFIFSQYSDK